MLLIAWNASSSRPPSRCPPILRDCYRIFLKIYIIYSDQFKKFRHPWPSPSIIGRKVKSNNSLTTLRITTFHFLFVFFCFPFQKRPYRLWTNPATYSISTGSSIPGKRQPELEAYHSHPGSTKVENTWSYTFTPPYTSMMLPPSIWRQCPGCPSVS
jgi:hypothetical protein